MKKLVVVFAAIFSVLSLASCGQQEAESVQETVKPDKIYIYSYNEDLKNDLEYVIKDYPQLSQKMEYIVPETENYGDYIQKLIENKNADNYPDIIVTEITDAKRFVESELTASTDEIGISNQDLGQMYEYTLAAVTDSNGKIKALSGEIYPGAFIYRKALAKEYLGTDDPQEVQSYVRDWSTFEDTARTIYKKSEGKTAMLASIDAMRGVFANSKSEGWLNGEEINMISSYKMFLEESYIFSKEKYALENDINSSEYIKAASKNAVFGYFATADFVTDGLTQDYNGMRATLGYVGDWEVCKGPAAYAEGGSWVFVSEASTEKELLGKVLKNLFCDMSVLEQKRNDTNAFVNNQKVMSNALNSGKGKISALGGSDYIETFSEQAESINLSTVGIYDKALDDMFFEVSEGYVKGNKSVEEIEEELKNRANEVLNPSEADRADEQDKEDEQNEE